MNAALYISYTFVLYAQICKKTSTSWINYLTDNTFKIVLILNTLSIIPR